MPLAEGPAMFLGGTMMSFALPYGAFIVISAVLYYLLRAKHSGPKLRYLATALTTSIVTREPGPVPAPPVSASAESAVAEAETPAAVEVKAEAEPEAEAQAEPTDEAEVEAEAEAAAESESEK